MQRQYTVVLSLLIVFACQSNKAVKQPSRFFPVTDFFTEQIRSVDSLQPPVTKYTTANGKTDSVQVEIPVLKELAQNFLTTDISDSLLSRYYTESSFADQTISSVTLTYATTNKGLPLQRLDVIIHPDPVLDDKVKSIYMEKSYRSHDTAILQKLYWRAGRNFQIITIRQSAALAPQTIVTKVVWNNSD